MSTSSAAKAGSVRSPAPGLDIFKTPENSTFYSANLYQDLDKSKQEIRLIEISTKSAGDGVLECKLLPATLLSDARKQYLALSYCAGDPADTNEIMVNGVTCNIFANLHHALVLARRTWIRSSGQGPLRVWVDQLCINQHDLRERSHQVGFMREIYQSAERTLACLSTTKTSGRGVKRLIKRILDYSPATITSGVGLKWLIDLCEAVPSREDDIPFQFRFEQGESDNKDKPDANLASRGSKKRPKLGECECNSGHRHQSIRMRDYLWENMHIEQFVDGWIAFYDVLTSPWWTRAWICQEFLVSAQVSFMFGHDSVSWERCWKIMQCFCRTHSHILLNRDLFLGVKGLKAGCPEDRQLCRILNIVQERDLKRQVEHVWRALRMKICWDGSIDILSLLSYSRFCKASDDRDRVYAMLGLVSPGYNIFPDYSNDLSASEVMTLTTRAIIEKDDSLGVLFEATKLVKRRNLDVPSWVVDWSSTEASDTDVGGSIIHGQNFIPHEPPQCAFETITDANGKARAHILRLYGTFITKIKRVEVWPAATFYSAQKQGWCGIALALISDGDELWFLYGSRVPMILRPYLDGYRIISSAALLRSNSRFIEEGTAERSRIKLY
ncbi:hypothetical protein F52700_6264 [Fusarium sp. NRRL 52700]|nr:hypothetical protein F52700_6264 [Fusarium sp. NRRL 52700]